MGIKHEAKFNTVFNHWLKTNYRHTACFELKQTQGDSIPFSALVDHQVKALQSVRHSTFVYKIPDCGYQNPFDGFCMTEMPSYVVLKYPAFFCFIDIDTFILERDRSKRRSLTSARAKALSTICVEL